MFREAFYLHACNSKLHVRSAATAVHPVSLCLVIILNTLLQTMVYATLNRNVLTRFCRNSVILCIIFTNHLGFPHIIIQIFQSCKHVFDFDLLWVFYLLHHLASWDNNFVFRTFVLVIYVALQLLLASWNYQIVVVIRARLSNKISHKSIPEVHVRYLIRRI